ncbi:MAG: hypothetical protein RL490_1076, partial [Pseudomonadota bacterium]
LGPQAPDPINCLLHGTAAGFPGQIKAKWGLGPAAPAAGGNPFPYPRAGRHNGPTATSSTSTLNSAFDGLPDAIEPALSRVNQASTP